MFEKKTNLMNKAIVKPMGCAFALLLALSVMGGRLQGQSDEDVQRQIRDRVQIQRAVEQAARLAAPFGDHPVMQAEGQPDQDPGDAATPETAADSETNDANDGPVTDTAIESEQPQLGKKFIRFHMWDGSIVGGEVAIDRIDIATEFGTLQIPIEKILKFYPGLDSIPELNNRISQLVDDLGDSSFDRREAAHRELLAMGLQIREQIGRFEDGGSVERKKHLAELRRQIDELLDDIDEADEQNVERALIQGDMIITSDFSIVGKIQQSDFLLASKFGELSVNLADIRLGDRSFNVMKPEVRKSVTVSGMSFFQTKPTSTKIRVNRGDKISIRASGVVQWTNWSTSSGPDGIDNQGQWEGMNSGTLAARIGNSTKTIKIGEKADFVASQSGVLFLGIAIRDNYAHNNGYRWEGEYTAKVTVKPAQD